MFTDCNIDLGATGDQFQASTNYRLLQGPDLAKVQNDRVKVGMVVRTSAQCCLFSCYYAKGRHNTSSPEPDGDRLVVVVVVVVAMSRDHGDGCGAHDLLEG